MVGVIFFIVVAFFTVLFYKDAIFYYKKRQKIEFYDSLFNSIFFTMVLLLFILAGIEYLNK